MRRIALARREVAVGAGALMWLAAAGTGHGQKASLSYSLPSEAILHEAIVLDLVVHNDGSEPIRVYLGLDDVASISFSVRSPNGSQTASPQILVRPAERGADIAVGSGDYEVAPGERQLHYVVLNRWFSFGEVGTYGLAVHFGGRVEGKAGDSLPVERDLKGEVRVLARDEAMIRQHCAHLLASIRDPIAGSRSLEALSYTVDPVAVEYIAEAASIVGGIDAQEPINGLVRIGGPEARRALEDLTKSSNTWTAMMARSGLTRIR